MSEALAEVEWIRGLVEELIHPRFNLVECGQIPESRSHGGRTVRQTLK